MMLSLENIGRVRISSPSDIRRAAIAYREIVKSALSLEIAAWHNIASGRPMVDAQGANLLVDVFGWSDLPDQRWWRRPRAALDQVSPLIAACRLHAEPFWCSPQGFFTHCPNPLLADLSWDDFHARVGAHAAIVAPVHLPFGQIGAVAFPALEPADADLGELFDRYADLLGLFTRRFITGYVNVTSDIRNVPADMRLTRREVECLHWAALGKTNEEIAMILALSLSTVRFHITNAGEKLGAINRGQAVLKAAQLGFIKPPRT